MLGWLADLKEGLVCIHQSQTIAERKPSVQLANKMKQSHGRIGKKQWLKYGGTTLNRKQRSHRRHQNQRKLSVNTEQTTLVQKENELGTETSINPSAPKQKP
jgi:hypothetical protein